MVKQLQGVTTKQPLKARADVVPRLVIAAKGDASFAVACVDASKIFAFLITPVIEINKKAKSAQEVRDGWDRVIKEVDFSITPGAKPLIVSARDNWKIYQDQINIIERAYVIDGAKYLEYLAGGGESKYVPMIVLFNKSEEEELDIRKIITGTGTFSLRDIKNKVGTDAPRLAISEKWCEIQIISDPFVIKTSMGYTAAVNVIDLRAQNVHHLIVGAKSVSNELEALRNKFGTLENLQIKIRKQSADPKSPYEIKI